MEELIIVAVWMLLAQGAVLVLFRGARGALVAVMLVGPLGLIIGVGLMEIDQRLEADPHFGELDWFDAEETPSTRVRHWTDAPFWEEGQ